MINIRSDNPELIERLIYKHGLLPFTFNKETKGGKRFTWTTSKRQYPESMADEQVRVDSFLRRISALGVHEPMMMDDTMRIVRESREILPHVVEFEEIKEWKKSDEFKKNGTTWLKEKPYHALFMSRDTHDKAKRDLGLDFAGVYPAGDCAVSRIYLPSLDTFGILHLSGDNIAKGVLDGTIKFIKDKLGVKPEDIEAYVGAFASHGWGWTGKVPPFATVKDENGNEIIGPDGLPLLNSQWDGFIDITRDDEGNVATAAIRYEENLRRKLKDNGISSENISMCTDCTIDNPDYRSNSELKKAGKRIALDLYGIDFIEKPKSLLLRRANNEENHIIVA